MLRVGWGKGRGDGVRVGKGGYGYQLLMNTTGRVMKLQRQNGENELMEKGGAGGRRSKKVPKSL